MIFKINRAEFESKLTRASLLANYKDASGIVLLRGGEKLSIFSSDGINAIQIPLSAELQDADGEFYINSRKLGNYLRVLGDETITIQIESGKMKIDNGNVKTEFVLESPGSYPEVPKIEMESGILLKVSDEFSPALNACAKTISLEQDRPILSYINFEYVNERLECFSTDGVRVTLMCLEVNNCVDIQTKNTPEPFSFNLPNQLSKMLTKSDVQIFVSEGQIFMILDDVIISSKKSLLPYPDIKKVCKRDFSFNENLPFALVWEIETKELSKNIGILKSILSDEKDKKIKLNFEKKQIETVGSRDHGSIELGGLISFGEESISAIGIDSVKLNIPNVEKIRVCIVSPTHPIMIFNADEVRDFKLISVLMPCKI